MPADSADLLHDVFISYARKDANLGAAPLDAALKPRCTVWRDIRGIDPSQDFTAEIEKAIKASRRVVVCVTPDVERDDSFVRREIAYASFQKKPILVARFADIAPPINVFTHTWIDFFKGWDDAFARLLSWLSGEAIATARAEPAPTPPVDPFAAYVRRVYETAVRDIDDSILSTNVLALHTVESRADVPRRLEQRFITHSIKKDLTPAEPPPETFTSLNAAYASANCDGRVLLLGKPGAGKTTTLLAFARDAAAARLSDPAQPLPVFARIAGWDSLNQTPLTDWLAAQNSSLTAPALQALIEASSALLLLDGLDELGSRREETKEVEGEAKEATEPETSDATESEKKTIKVEYDPRERFLKALPPTSRVILSSRVEEYRAIHQQAALNCAVRLEPLDDAQMQAYLADVPDLWQVIAADASLKEALRTPLLLALVRVGFEGTPDDVRALRDLSAGDLNDRIWDAFIDQRWAHEQARQPDVPLPYTAAELKQRLGRAVMRAMSDDRGDHIRIVARDIGGGDALSVIALAQRLDLLRPAGDEPVGRYHRTAPSHRFLHLRLRDALALPVALETLKDPVAKDARGSAAVALGKLGDARAVRPLIVTLQDPDSIQHELAANALLKLGELDTPISIEAFLTLLHVPYSRIRAQAANGLGRLGDARAVEPLIRALRDPEGLVRHSAVEALVKFGELAVEPLIPALQYPERSVRISAAEGLGKIGDARAVEPLIAALCDPERYVRISAAEGLGKIGDIRAVEPLIAALHDTVGLDVASVLSRLGEPTVKPLIAALRDQDENVRNSAAWALGELGDARAVEPLITALRDQDENVRSSTVYALAKIGEPAVRLLIAALHDPEWRVRISAADALGRLHDTYAVEPLIAALHDPEWRVRRSAAGALGKSVDARAVEPLITALNDPYGDVRSKVAWALGVSGDVRAIKPLIAVLQDPNWDARSGAASALTEFPDHPSARQALADFKAGKLPPRTK